MLTLQFLPILGKYGPRALETSSNKANQFPGQTSSAVRQVLVLIGWYFLNLLSTDETEVVIFVHLILLPLNA